MDIVTRRVGATLWVYVPLNIALFDVKASDPKDAPERKINPFSLLSLQAEFTEQFFKFNYDLVPDVISGEAQTYGSTYNEAFTTKRQTIYAGLQETFFNAKSKNKDLMPDFIVVMAMDISRGVGVKSYFYLQDFKKYASQALPSEEYFMREINEVMGNKKLIQDTKGLNVPYAEITWPHFLTEQIKGRIRFKFSQSDFPPETNPVDEMSRIAANTLGYYPEFTLYKGVVLYGVRDKKETVLDRKKLKDLEEKPLRDDDNGKLTTIHFSLPEDPAAKVDATSAPDANTTTNSSF